MDWDEWADAVVTCTTPFGCIELRSAPLTYANGPFPDTQRRTIYIVVHDFEAADNIPARLRAPALGISASLWPAAISAATDEERTPGAALVGIRGDIAQAVGRSSAQPILIVWRPDFRTILSCVDGRQRFTGWSSRWGENSLAEEALQTDLPGRSRDHSTTIPLERSQGAKEPAVADKRIHAYKDAGVVGGAAGFDFYQVLLQWMRHRLRS